MEGYIWTLKIPGMVKMFMCRAGNDLFATKKNLYNRKSSKDPLCPICNSEEETILHIFWQCPAANDSWAEDRSPVKKYTMIEEDFFALWGKIIKIFDILEMEWIVVTIKKIWRRRNEYVFESKLCSPKKVIQAMDLIITEFEAIQEESKILKTSRRT